MDIDIQTNGGTETIQAIQFAHPNDKLAIAMVEKTMGSVIRFLKSSPVVGREPRRYQKGTGTWRMGGSREAKIARSPTSKKRRCSYKKVQPKTQEETNASIDACNMDADAELDLGGQSESESDRPSTAPSECYNE